MCENRNRWDKEKIYHDRNSTQCKIQNNVEMTSEKYIK